MVYRQGLLKWEKSGFPIDTVIKYPKVNVPLISSKELDGMPEASVFLLDIRPPNHFQKGHIERAINIDLENLQDKIQDLPRHKQIILIDHKGKLTLTTGRYLYSKGFRDLTRLDGGFNAWVKSGLPFEK
jgi:rhodanese-related sulfurtransferase